MTYENIRVVQWCVKDIGDYTMKSDKLCVRELGHCARKCERTRMLCNAVCRNMKGVQRCVKELEDSTVIWGNIGWRLTRKQPDQYCWAIKLFLGNRFVGFTPSRRSSWPHARGQDLLFLSGLCRGLGFPCLLPSYLWVKRFTSYLGSSCVRNVVFARFVVTGIFVFLFWLQFLFSSFNIIGILITVL